MERAGLTILQSSAAPKSASPPKESKPLGDGVYIADGDYIKDIEVNDLRNRYLLTKGSTQKMVIINSLLCIADILGTRMRTSQPHLICCFVFFLVPSSLL